MSEETVPSAESSIAPASDSPTATYTGGVITAKASWDYLWRRYMLVAVIIGSGLWFAYDGFYSWPAANLKQHQADPLQKPPHTSLDVLLNQTFGIVLPPLGILVLLWARYSSRGCYKFDGTTLSVPGHDDVPLTAIRTIDKSKWDRKGIAYLEYEVPGSSKLETLTLDDFVYEQSPTDKIFKQIEIALGVDETVGESETAAVETPEETN